MTPDLITIELARLVETGTEWQRKFKEYDRLIDAGLSCEEAARIVTQAEADRAAFTHPEPMERAA